VKKAFANIDPKRAIAAGVIVVAVVYIVMANRSIAPFSRTNIATFLVVGLSLGGIYAISACGLVGTYTTTGIFNFAHGAIGCFCAFAYWELRVNRNVPTPVALVLVIFVIAPLIGVVLDKVLMQRLRMASLVVQLMVTVGLMLAFMVAQGFYISRFLKDEETPKETPGTLPAASVGPDSR
jgi:branched-subunit amino acid ABC-type transport system permease component